MGGGGVGQVAEYCLTTPSTSKKKKKLKATKKLTNNVNQHQNKDKHTDDVGYKPRKEYHIISYHMYYTISCS